MTLWKGNKFFFRNTLVSTWQIFPLYITCYFLNNAPNAQHWKSIVACFNTLISICTFCTFENTFSLEKVEYFYFLLLCCFFSFFFFFKYKMFFSKQKSIILFCASLKAWILSGERMFFEFCCFMCMCISLLYIYIGELV